MADYSNRTPYHRLECIFNAHAMSLQCKYMVMAYVSTGFYDFLLEILHFRPRHTCEGQPWQYRRLKIQCHKDLQRSHSLKLVDFCYELFFCQLKRLQTP